MLLPFRNEVRSAIPVGKLGSFRTFVIGCIPSEDDALFLSNLSPEAELRH